MNFCWPVTRFKGQDKDIPYIFGLYTSNFWNLHLNINWKELVRIFPFFLMDSSPCSSQTTMITQETLIKVIQRIKTISDRMSEKSVKVIWNSKKSKILIYYIFSISFSSSMLNLNKSSIIWFAIWTKFLQFQNLDILKDQIFLQQVNA